MHLKFLDHGTGSAKKAANYLLADKDHQGIKRAKVTVLRGDPMQFAAVADALSFVQRYSSAVIAFHENDNPTPEQIENVIKDFEKLAFAGLNLDRVSYCAVLHDEHLHILIARVDLKTGKSFNPAPPGWQKSFDALRDSHNYENNWARPDDPRRARKLQPGKFALDVVKARLKDRVAMRDAIHKWIESRIDAGMIADRAGVLASLKEIGEITRQGNDYISVKPEGTDKAIRLKGSLYEQGFTTDNLASRATSRQSGERSAEDRERAERAGRSARSDLERSIESRRKFNEIHFAEPRKRAARQRPDANQINPMVVALADSGSPDLLPTGLARDLGLLEKPAAVPIQTVTGEKHDGHRKPILSTWTVGSTNRPGIRSSEVLERQRLPSLLKSGNGNRQQQNNDPFLLSVSPGYHGLYHTLHSLYARVRHGYDRARETVVGRTRIAFERLGNAINRTRHQNRDLGEASQGLNRALHSENRAIESNNDSNRAFYDSLGRANGANRALNQASLGLKSSANESIERLESALGQVERLIEEVAAGLADSLAPVETPGGG